ncbi:hypothetical protein CEXT_622341 [Caerostris extrusa]|uniref:Uncharacterized protein n=1 Tax=Caerostris extrusa TaxID=172846 RepID=A0AAV4SDD2_CAEEX|nr:hypothetical protein CEXT_622341 [Caerostris extrusa]
MDKKYSCITWTKSIVVPWDKGIVAPRDKSIVVPRDKRIVVPRDKRIVVPRDKRIVVPRDKRIVVSRDKRTVASHKSIVASRDKIVVLQDKKRERERNGSQDGSRPMIGNLVAGMIYDDVTRGRRRGGLGMAWMCVCVTPPCHYKSLQIREFRCRTTRHELKTRQ